MTSRKPGKRLFKFMLLGVEWEVRLVSQKQLDALSDTVDCVDAVTMREHHAIYILGSLGKGFPTILLHELLHLPGKIPQAQDTMCRIFRTNNNTEKADEIEEAWVSYVAPILISVIVQVPRRLMR